METRKILNFIKVEAPSESGDNNIVLELEVKVKAEVESEEQKELDWSIQNKAVLSQSLDPSDDVVDFKELQAVSFEKCLMCHALFMDRYHLLKHNLNHLIIPLSEARLYQCDHCLFCFTDKNKLKVHIQLKHFTVVGYEPAKTRECQICYKAFSYKHWLDHLKEVHGTGALTCEHCGVKFKCRRYLKKHVRNKHQGVENGCKKKKKKEKGPMQCDLCPKIFKSQPNLTVHKKNCHSAPAVCTICGSKLRSQTYLYAHIRRVHYDDGKEHKCDICSKKFRSKRYVDIHFRNSHVKGKSNSFLRCQYCDKKMSTKNRLQEHIMEKCPVVIKSNINKVN